ncbi:C69 family dipeptidase [Lapidilactobacillus salsurivasis]
MSKPTSACTTILVGKRASRDGSTMIARNNDGGVLNPKKFVLVRAADQPCHYQAPYSDFNLDLPPDPLSYTSTPAATDPVGIGSASGINRKNVAMSASETITNNGEILGVDPLVANGIGEEDLIATVLPFIDSARAGVLRLGQLVETYGTCETNGIAFADQEEIWYMETIGGHHWAARRLPDDCYVVAPNRFNLTEFDFSDPTVLFAAGLPQLISDYHLNPDVDTVNLRHIFGTATVKDTHYNNPRTWYGQRYFNPEIVQDPCDFDLPFCQRPARLIGIEDLKFVLSSHYQNTPFDPYGPGTEADKMRFRPIAMSRNQEMHILQLRPDVDTSIAAIHWVAFGPNTFNMVVPFYAHCQDTPASYRDTATHYAPDQAFWLSNTLALLGDAHYNLYLDSVTNFASALLAACRQLQGQADALAPRQADPARYLTKINADLAQCYLTHSYRLMDQLLALGKPQMKIQFMMKD